MSQAARRKLTAAQGPLRIVVQQDTHGCAAAVAATFLRCSYEEGKDRVRTFKCSHAGCAKCRTRRRPDDYKACAHHLADLLASNGFDVKPTKNIYSSRKHPVLVKFPWDPSLLWGHFVIWLPTEKRYLCPSGYTVEKRQVDQCFRWTDEPAFIVKPKRFER